MSREPTLLPRLEPPTGGLARLRAKRHAAEQRAAAWPSRRLAYASALAGSAFALLLLLPVGAVWDRPLLLTHAADRLLGARAEGPQLHALDNRIIVQPLTSDQPNVRLYWAEQLPSTASTAERPE